MSDLLKNPRAVAAAAAALVVAAVVLLVAVWPEDEAPAPDRSAAAAPAPSGPAGSAPGGLAAADLDGDGIVYQSGMHPWIVQDEPGQCPICGMDLQPVRVDGQEEGTVRIDPVTLQNIGVRTAVVAVEALPRTARTTGRFEADERLASVVSPRIGGWVERLFVNYEGARVRAGQPLLEIYSPELVSTQEEYLLALRNRERLAGTPAEADAARLVAAARRRLAYWDVPDEAVRRLEETAEPQRTVTLRAPTSGTVTRLGVVQGERIQAGQNVMALAGLQRLWLMADVYEQDLAWVGPGTDAVVELPYEPGRTLRGQVDFVYDRLDEATRTVRARIPVANPDGRLKPGMYATVQLLGEREAAYPVVPSEAVVRGGEREVVVLAEGEGRFRPVPVRTGLEAGGKTQILTGLEGGERVVTSAQFLIDSEARLASAIGAMMNEAGEGQDG